MQLKPDLVQIRKVVGVRRAGAPSIPVAETPQDSLEGPHVSSGGDTQFLYIFSQQNGHHQPNKG